MPVTNYYYISHLWSATSILCTAIAIASNKPLVLIGTFLGVLMAVIALMGLNRMGEFEQNG